MSAGHGYARFGVECRRSRALVGLCGFKQISNNIDLGWRYASAVWNRGIASEAAAVTLQYGRPQLGLEKIAATSLSGNLASLHVIEKLGMQFVSSEPISTGFTSLRFESKQPIGDRLVACSTER